MAEGGNANGMSVMDMFNLLRQDLQSGIARMESRLEKVVTNDLFVAEQKRVDGRFRDVNEDVADLRATNAGLERQLAAEVAARKDAEATALRANEARQADLARQKATIRWSLVGIIASPIISIVLGFVVAGGLSRP